jgi:hypothetical protein
MAQSNAGILPVRHLNRLIPIKGHRTLHLALYRPVFIRKGNPP